MRIPVNQRVFFEKYEGVNYMCLNYIPWIRNPGIPNHSNPANFFKQEHLSDWVVDSNMFIFTPTWGNDPIWRKFFKRVVETTN